jgi:parvulin-like peptidyl-prolyl isomerase
MNKTKWLSLITLGAMTILFMCSGRNTDMDDSPVVATSGKATLHLNDLNSFVLDNPGFEISTVQISNYIQRWSEKELIYQKALEEKFDEHPDIQKKVHDLAKDFIVAAYLHDNIDSKLSVTDDEIRSYYDEKADEFIRQQDYYNLELLLVESSREAYQVRQRLLSGEDFQTLAKELSLDESRSKGGKLGWITLDILPEEVARRVPSLALNTVSTPIRTSLGYYLVLVLEERKKGEVQTLEEVRDIIEWRIRAKSRQDMYQELLATLREQHDVQINWSYLDSLSLER